MFGCACVQAFTLLQNYDKESTIHADVFSGVEWLDRATKHLAESSLNVLNGNEFRKKISTSAIGTCTPSFPWPEAKSFRCQYETDTKL